MSVSIISASPPINQPTRRHGDPGPQGVSLAAADLLKRGYSESRAAKIGGGSFMRLFKEVSGGSQT